MKQRTSARDDDKAVADPEGPLVLYGIHVVEAALANPRREILKLRLTENAERRLGAALDVHRALVERATPRDLDRRLGPDTVHQGVMLVTAPLPEPDLVDLMLQTADRGPLVILDQVTDPHNVGAILRSAAAFGSAGLVMTRRHSPPLTGTLAKSASGALELVPVALVQNLARAIEDMKAAHVTVIGLDSEAPDDLEAARLSGPLAIVLGAEGKGLRQLTRESCSTLCRIATVDALASLNVSNAAAIALHSALRQRRISAPLK